MTTSVAGSNTAFSRAAAHPQNIEAIQGFLTSKDHAVLDGVCKVFQKHTAMETASRNERIAYRYPYHGVKDVSQATDIYFKVKCNPVYLREPDGISGYTPAFEAFLNDKIALTEWYLTLGGALATTPKEKEYIWNYRSLHTDHPIIGTHIRQLKWDMAKTDEQKKEVLEWLMEETCHKGNLTGLRWALEKAETLHIPVSIFRSLELATQGGFEDIFEEVCKRTDLSQLTDGEKEHLVAKCTELRYSTLLLSMSNQGFPVKAEHLKEIVHFLSIRNILREVVRFPQAASALSHASHGGDDNLDTAKGEYQDMVAYAYNFLRKGGDVRKLIDNLCHKRLRMAVIGKRNSLDYYGKFTSETMSTNYGTAYREYGERIRAKYKQFPVLVNAQIGNKTILMTMLYEDRWVHPDGSERDAVLGEVARLCEPLLDDVQDDIAKPLARIIWLMSHYPPCERGTPIVLRALVDAICFKQGLRIDPGYEINCDALVYDDCEEFAAAFAARAQLTKPAQTNPNAEK